MGGITLADTIVAARRAPADPPTWMRFLFHELVHVVQFDILGVERFVARYLEEWARAGYRYRGIALEAMAYRLDARYAANPGEAFDVRALVALALANPEPLPPPPPAATTDR
jgi:hypothetical protein